MKTSKNHKANDNCRLQTSLGQWTDTLKGSYTGILDANGQALTLGYSGPKKRSWLSTPLSQQMLERLSLTKLLVLTPILIIITKVLVLERLCVCFCCLFCCLVCIFSAFTVEGVNTCLSTALDALQVRLDTRFALRLTCSITLSAFLTTLGTCLYASLSISTNLLGCRRNLLCLLLTVSILEESNETVSNTLPNLSTCFLALLAKLLLTGLVALLLRFTSLLATEDLVTESASLLGFLLTLLDALLGLLLTLLLLFALEFLTLLLAALFLARLELLLCFFRVFFDAFLHFFLQDFGPHAAGCLRSFSGTLSEL